ncbi:hypothetical protein K491DRAFT_690578 [Lophiostoma macrostomum CBS 122681]|uniref:Uncharacterized protein n=1 Tax=Lophiostoma macrostomum CBS 122681 TaxID=1314788 RepID=A0A6A6TDD7_9PLEO|nr:hypothetical protein K491DRAFT_690578 [Lophiostoma macrostomum CBS 122681]
MAKRNSDGDVLANQFSVMLAHKQRTRAFELGSKSGHDSKQEAVRDDRQEDDFKDEALGHDRCVDTRDHMVSC